ncbi:MAG: asparaginase [Acidobacteriota bacterium]|nr:asparaginase [Acidobacteriota bacterium]
MTERFALVARSTRGAYTESWHFGAVAVTTPDGRLVARIGDPTVRVFMRSIAKPIQAAPLMMANGPLELGLSPEDIALLCASHAGTPAHTERVERLLLRGGFDVADLACGAHEPLCEATAEAMRRKGESPSALHSNCSGNHAGVLLACRLLGYVTEGYAHPEHPLNRRILELLARFCGLGPPDIEVAVDGCELPTYRVPLAAAALAWARLADPAGGGLEAAERDAVRTLIEAMATCPDMVAGCERFTTRLIEVTGGRIVGKEGADGLYAMAIRGPMALGAVVKIADGKEGCRAGVVLDVLRQLGSLSAEEFEQLQEFYRPAISTRRGVVVGAVTPDVHLKNGDEAAEIETGLAESAKR